MGYHEEKSIRIRFSHVKYFYFILRRKIVVYNNNMIHTIIWLGLLNRVFLISNFIISKTILGIGTKAK